MMKAFVTGWPVSHSKSPKLHGFWLNQYGIDGTYEAIAVEPEKFPSFLGNLPTSGFIGGNVTLPHKEAAFELVSRRTEAAEMIGAVNTLWFQNGVLHADNTDAYGFTANLDQLAAGWRNLKTATVLGAGGASRAVIHGLLATGFSSVRITNRTVERAKALSDRFGERTSSHALDELGELLSDTDLLVNTTSIGMAGSDEAAIPDISRLPSHALVTDIVYTPLITPLLAQAQELGLKSVDGLGMLLHQAVPGFEAWFGKRPEVSDELRAYVLRSS